MPLSIVEANLSDPGRKLKHRKRREGEWCLFMASFHRINPFPLILQLHQIKLYWLWWSSLSLQVVDERAGKNVKLISFVFMCLIWLHVGCEGAFMTPWAQSMHSCLRYAHKRQTRNGNIFGNNITRMGKKVFAPRISFKDKVVWSSS